MKSAVLILHDELLPYLNFLIDNEYVSQENAESIKEWINLYLELPKPHVEFNKGGHIIKVYECNDVEKIANVARLFNEEQNSIYDILTISKLAVVNRSKYESFYKLIDDPDISSENFKNRYLFLDFAQKEIESKKEITVTKIRP